MNIFNGKPEKKVFKKTETQDINGLIGKTIRFIDDKGCSIISEYKVKPTPKHRIFSNSLFSKMGGNKYIEKEIKNYADVYSNTKIFEWDGTENKQIDTLIEKL